MSLKSIIDFLRSDGSIILNKRLAHAIGLDATIMYSEIISKQIYFEDRGQLTKDGFFFNTVENMQEDTTLSRDRQLRAIKKLIQLNLIKQSNRGIPRKRYFKVNENENIVESILSSQNKTYSSRKIRQQDNAKVDGNNTKNNINKKIYLISANEALVFNYYSDRYKKHFSQEHPTMNEEKNQEIVSRYHVLSGDLDIDDERWMDLVDYHFDNLPRNNNGNILSFLADNGGTGCVYRYLEDMAYEEE